MPSSSSLTTHLLTLHPSLLKKATTHPFLPSAAQSTLPKETLIHWLAQDRLYALSYISFIGSLLSNLHLSPHLSASDPENRKWKVVEGLVDCLTNIRREVRMFEDTAREEGFLEELLGVREERATRCYRDLFAGASSGGKGTVVGLVVLWASEVCYLRAWKFAEGFLDHDDGRKEEGGEEGGDVMQRVFIPNWSCGEFEGFVGRLGELVDLLGEEVQVGGEVWRECEEGWRQVLWCEGEFWPEV